MLVLALLGAEEAPRALAADEEGEVGEEREDREQEEEQHHQQEDVAEEVTGRLVIRGEGDEGGRRAALGGGDGVERERVHRDGERPRRARVGDRREGEDVDDELELRQGMIVRVLSSANNSWCVLLCS